MNLIYVLLPYAIGFVGWVSVTYGLARLTLAKDPVREYVHVQTAAKLPGRGILSAVFSGIAVIGTLGAVFFGNTGDNWISYVSFLLPEVAACGISIRIVCIFTELSWVKIVQDSENVRTEGK